MTRCRIGKSARMRATSSGTDAVSTFEIIPF
jgi:hypothetical protein